MKIIGYRLAEFEVKLDRIIGDANQPAGGYIIGCALLRIDTDEGVTGIAPAGNEAVGKLFPVIEGADPRAVAAIWQRMSDAVFKGGSTGAMNEAVSAIDIALWDLKAKLAGEPLWRTFGARRPRVRAYASGIDMNLSDGELFRFYRDMAEQGIDSGKLKVGLDINADLRRLGIMREALSVAGGRPGLMIDSNEYWSPKEAISRIGRMEREFDLVWVEEPARRWDAEGLRRVSRRVSAAVATGENLNQVAEFRPLIAAQAVDMLNIGPSLSGFTGARQVANLALAHKLPVSMMNCQAHFAAHLAAALPNHSMMEVAKLGRSKCFRFAHRLDDGDILLSDEPGLGISVDEAKLDALVRTPPTADRQRRLPFDRRADAGRAGAYLDESRA